MIFVKTLYAYKRTQLHIIQAYINTTSEMKRLPSSVDPTLLPIGHYAITDGLI